jgi:biotin carboxyl carrier protein
MKMENAIKSPCDAIIDTVHISVGQAVDKNHILVQFA